MAMVPGYPVPRDQWVKKGTACASCNKEFSFFNSKANCPCCGKLSCASCLSAECTVTPGNPAEKVCLNCFSMIQNYRYSQKQSQLDELADALPSTSPAETAPSEVGVDGKEEDSKPETRPAPETIPQPPAPRTAASHSKENPETTSGQSSAPSTQAASNSRRNSGQTTTTPEGTGKKKNNNKRNKKGRNQASASDEPPHDEPEVQSTAAAGPTSAGKSTSAVPPLSCPPTREGTGEVVASDDVQSLVAHAESMRHENQQWMSKCKMAETELRGAKQELAELTQKLSDAVASSSKLEKEHAALREESEKQKLAIRDVAKKQQETVEDLAAHKKEGEEGRKREAAAASKAEAHIRELTQNIEEVTGKLAASEAQCTAIREESNALREKYAAVTEEAKTLREKYEAEQRALEEATNAHRTNDAESASKRDALNDAKLAALVSSHEEEVSQLRAALDGKVKELTEAHDAEVARLQAESEKQSDASNVKTDAAQREMETLSKTVEDERSRADQAEKEITSLRDQLKEAQRLSEVAETASHAEADAAIAQARSDVEASRAELEEITSKQKAEAELLNDKAETIALGEKELEEAREQLEKERAALETLREETEEKVSHALAEEERVNALQKDMEERAQSLQESEAELQQREEELAQAKEHLAAQELELTVKEEEINSKIAAFAEEQEKHEQSVNDLNAKSVETHSALQDLQAKHIASSTAANDQVAELEQSIAELRAELEAKEAEFSSRGKANHEELQGLHEEITNFQIQSELSATNLASLEREKKELDEELQRTLVKLQEAEESISELVASAEEAKRQHGTAISDVEEALHVQLEKLQEDCASKDAFIARLKSALDSHAKRVQELLDERQLESDAKHDANEQRSAELAQQESTIAARAEELQTMESDLEEREKNLQAALDKHAAAIREFEETQQRAEEESARKEKDLEVLQSDHEAAVASWKEKQSVLEASFKEREASVVAKEKRVARILGGDTIHAPSLGEKGSAKCDLNRRSVVPDIDVSNYETLATVLPPSFDFASWNCDTIAVSQTMDSVLQTFALAAAERWDLLRTLSISKETWIKFVACIESNYTHNPYHNCTHAADVLQGAVSLVTACDGLLEQMTPMEKFALVFATIVHDVRHPGCGAMFLEKTLDPVHFEYSGVSTLEQMHITTAFRIMRLPEFNITKNFDREGIMQLHRLVSKIVLCTDMAEHQRHMKSWGERLKSNPACEPFNFSEAKDRHEMIAMLCHAADIGGCARQPEVGLKWMTITEEFSRQGKAEEKAGVPVSPGCERDVDIHMSQVKFIDYAVYPMFDLVQTVAPRLTSTLRNINKIRAIHTAEIMNPPPPPTIPDYTNPLRRRIADLESELAVYVEADDEVKRKDAEFAAIQRRLVEQEEDMARRTTHLEELEQIANDRSADMAARELKVFDAEAKMNAVAAKEKEVKMLLHNAVDASIEMRSLGEVSHAEARLRATSSALTERESALRAREATVHFEALSLDDREARLAALSESLALTAEELAEQKAAADNILAREEQVSLRELAAENAEASVRHAKIREIGIEEMEGRLAIRLEEIDHELAVAQQYASDTANHRSIGLGILSNLRSTLEREERVRRVVGESKDRRRIAAHWRAAIEVSKVKPCEGVSSLSKLEKAVFQLTSAIAHVAKETRPPTSTEPKNVAC